MRARSLILTVLLLSLLAPVADAQRQRRATRRERPRAVRLSSSEILIKILQHEDTRWIGSDNFLAEQTRSRDSAIKMRVLLALGRIGDPAGLPWLFDRLTDPSPRVRARALFAIGEIIDSSNLEHEGHQLRSEWLTPVLESLTDLNPPVRTRAIEAIGKSADKTHAERIVATVLKRAQAPEVITHGLIALVRMGESSSIERVLSLRTHPSPEVRWQLANAVYRLRNKRAAAQLRPLLTDSSRQVAAHAARAYGLAGGGAVGSLASLLRDTNPRVKVEAARGLGLTDSASAVQPLVSFMRQYLASVPDEDEHVLTAALESWGNLKPGTGLEVVSQLAKEPRPAASAALVALAKVRKGDESFPNEIDISGDPFWLQRSKVQALGENSSRAALAKLLTIATQAAGQMPLLLPWCLDAMIQTGRPIHPEAFWRYLTEKDPFLRAHAIAALAELSRRPGDARGWTGEAAERVMRSYFLYQTDRIIDARLAVADFIATLDAQRAVPQLERIAKDPDRNVRVRARNLLRSRFGRTAPGIAGLVNTGRNYSFYASATRTVKRYWGARFTTDRGNFTVRFFGDDAPLTVYNFITLVQRGFLDKLTFPRVVPDFVVQGGDPRNDTDGGPGYSIRCEINDRPFLRGTVGMALSGKDTGGSQYFVCHSPQPHLDGGYTAFAQVTDGDSVVDRILLGDRVMTIELIPQGSADSRAAAAEETTSETPSRGSSR